MKGKIIKITKKNDSKLLRKYTRKSNSIISEVKQRTLHAIPDERGRLMEIFRSDWPEYKKFGQVYMTTVYPGVVKAWHYHKLQTDNMACIKGMLKLVLYDSRKDSDTYGLLNEFFIGENNPMLIQIPRLVFHGFKCISETEAVVINVPTELYQHNNSDEYRIPPHTKEIPYDWARRDG